MSCITYPDGRPAVDCARQFFIYVPTRNMRPDSSLNWLQISSRCGSRPAAEWRHLALYGSRPFWDRATPTSLVSGSTPTLQPHLFTQSKLPSSSLDRKRLSSQQQPDPGNWPNQSLAGRADQTGGPEVPPEGGRRTVGGSRCMASGGLDDAMGAQLGAAGVT